MASTGAPPPRSCRWNYCGDRFDVLGGFVAGDCNGDKALVRIRPDRCCALRSLCPLASAPDRACWTAADVFIRRDLTSTSAISYSVLENPDTGSPPFQGEVPGTNQHGKFFCDNGPHYCSIVVTDPNLGGVADLTPRMDDR